MSTLKKFKSLSNKQVKRIISLFLMVGLGSTSAITVSALSKDVTIKDGEEITKFRTLHSETNAVLKQAGINISENDTFMPSMRRLSATISLSTRFFLVPGYVTVARASIINFGYNVIVI